LRILHLVSSHRWTGVAEPAADLARAQLALGHEVTFACVPGHSFWRRLAKRGVPTVNGFAFRPGLDLTATWRDIGLLRRQARELAVDVVHCHQTHDHWLAALALGSASRRQRRQGPILVRTLHREGPGPQGALERWLWGRATDLLIAVSRSIEAAVGEALRPEEDQLVHIHGAVDLERFHPGLDGERNRRLWRIPPQAPVAGMVARLRRGRGHLDFIRTIGEVAARIPEARYIVGGRGELKPALRATIQTHPLRQRLIQVGYRKRDLAETYAAMDVAVLLAPGSDGSCRGMLEAMACGRPVIGARRGAIADTIEPGRTGWLIDPARLSEELPRALIEALADRECARRMGEAARRAMEASFTQRHRAEATLAAYGAAFRRRRAGGSSADARSAAAMAGVDGADGPPV